MDVSKRLFCDHITPDSAVPPPGYTLSDEECYRLYNDMLANEKHYKRNMGTYFTDLRVYKERKSYISNKTDKTLFVNQDHHELCLKICEERFPSYYQLKLNRENQSGSFSSETLVENHEMFNEYPELLEKLTSITLQSAEKSQAPVISQELDTTHFVLGSAVNFYRSPSYHQNPIHLLYDLTHAAQNKLKQVATQ